MRVAVPGQVNEDLLEDGLVEPLALLAYSLAVQPAGVSEQQEHKLKVLADKFHVLLAGGDQAVGIMYLNEHRRLSELEVFHRDGFIKVGVDELLLLALQLEQPLPLVGEEGLVLFLPRVEAASRQLAYLLNGLLGELHLRAPDALNLLFDFLHRDIRQIAIGAAGVPPEAEEIAVDATLAPGVAIAHASTAASAEQRALQVMGVPP